MKEYTLNWDKIQLDDNSNHTFRLLEKYIHKDVKFFYGYSLDTNSKVVCLGFKESRPFNIKSTKGLAFRYNEIIGHYENEEWYFTAIINRANHNDALFDTFCELLVDRLSITVNTYKEANSLILNFIEYFRTEKLPMTIEEIQGLFTELHFLNILLNVNISLFDSWVGYINPQADFIANDIAFEIKSNIKLEKVVKIPNDRELNLTNYPNTYLVLISLNKQKKFGKSLNDIVFYTKERLSDYPTQLKKFNAILLTQGYSSEQEQCKNALYFVRDIEYYQVKPNFPRLSSDVVNNNALSKVSYSINLGLCEGFKVHFNIKEELGD